MELHLKWKDSIPDYDRKSEVVTPDIPQFPRFNISVPSEESEDE